MRVLAVTNMYPFHKAPTLGIHVAQQIIGLQEIGLEVKILFLNRFQNGMSVYFETYSQVASQIEAFNPEVVHVMYGGVMADLVTRRVLDRPTIVTFHGADLLGEELNGPLRKLLAHYGVKASHRAARRAHGVVVVSKSLEKTLPKDLDRSKV